MSTTIEIIGNDIIRIATRFVNLYETDSNAAWDDPGTVGSDPQATELRRLMEQCGWHAGWAYCAAFCEAVWRTAYTDLQAPTPIIQEIAAKLTPSVMQSFHHWGSRVTRVPLPGSVFFMQLGATGNGHAGIVVKATETRFATIEGNTSPDPNDAEADREGDGVFKRTRSLDFTQRSGLWLRGFLNPIPF